MDTLINATTASSILVADQVSDILSVLGNYIGTITFYWFAMVFSVLIIRKLRKLFHRFVNDTIIGGRFSWIGWSILFPIFPKECLLLWMFAIVPVWKIHMKHACRTRNRYHRYCKRGMTYRATHCNEGTRRLKMRLRTGLERKTPEKLKPIRSFEEVVEEEKERKKMETSKSYRIWKTMSTFVHRSYVSISSVAGKHVHEVVDSHCRLSKVVRNIVMAPVTSRRSGLVYVRIQFNGAPSKLV